MGKYVFLTLCRKSCPMHTRRPRFPGRQLLKPSAEGWASLTRWKEGHTPPEWGNPNVTYLGPKGLTRGQTQRQSAEPLGYKKKKRQNRLKEWRGIHVTLTSPISPAWCLASYRVCPHHEQGATVLVVSWRGRSMSALKATVPKLTIIIRTGFLPWAPLEVTIGKAQLSCPALARGSGADK